MTRLRTVIAEDEPLARQLLEQLLAEIPNIELVAICANGRSAVAATLEHNPDLLILDIQMPGLNGFDVVRELQADVMPMVIFCTAFERYAVDAFDLYAVDYLLKPLRSDRLERAVERALSRHAEQRRGAQNKQPLVGAIEEISRRVSGKTSQAADSADDSAPRDDDKMAIKDGHHTVLVSVRDIDWVDAAGDYMCVHVDGQTHVMRSTLKNLMSRLDPDTFQRIHRSTIVNVTRIDKITPLAKGEFMLHLSCNEQLKVSRNYRAGIKSYLDEL